MTERLGGSVALVTGASSGIGEATARALAAEGTHVVLAARREDRIKALADELSDGDRRAIAVTTDVTNNDEAVALVERTVSELGRLDIVINNAGVMLLGPVEGAPLEEWQRMVTVNVLGLLYVAHAALPHLITAAEDSPRGVSDLVNVSSVAGRVARSGSAVYNGTKHAVGAFSEGLRQEVTGRHVRIGLIEPGAVATELASHNRPEVEDQLVKRFGSIERLEAEDIADAVTYMVTRSRRVAVNEILVRPTEQEG